MNSKKGGSLASNRVHRLLNRDCKKGGKRSRAKKSKSKSKKSKRRTKKPKLVKTKKRTRNKKTKKKMKGGFGPEYCKIKNVPKNDYTDGKICDGDIPKIYKTTKFCSYHYYSIVATRIWLNSNKGSDNPEIENEDFLNNENFINVFKCKCNIKDIDTDMIIEQPFGLNVEGSFRHCLPLCAKCTEFKDGMPYKDGDKDGVLINKIKSPRFYY